MKFKNMFSPIQIGPMTVKNRFVVPPNGEITLQIQMEHGAMSLLHTMLNVQKVSLA